MVALANKHGGIIPLARMKIHLRVDQDDEDYYIQALIDAAVAFTAQDMGRGLYLDTVPQGDPSGLVVTPDLEAALLLLVGHWYAHREAVASAQQEVPLGYWRLVQHYRLYGA